MRSSISGRLLWHFTRERDKMCSVTSWSHSDEWRWQIRYVVVCFCLLRRTQRKSKLFCNVCVNALFYRNNTSQTSGKTVTCTTSDSNCTVDIKSSTTFDFCISITAHLDSGDVTSRRECQSGIPESEDCDFMSHVFFSRATCSFLTLFRFSAIFPPVTLENVTPHLGDAECLTVAWNYSNDPRSHTKIVGENGKLKSQIEIITEGQVCRLTDTKITFIIRS